MAKLPDGLKLTPSTEVVERDGKKYVVVKVEGAVRGLVVATSEVTIEMKDPAPPARADWTREELIAICEAAIVNQDDWHDRDSAGAQLKVGEAWALLRSGCEFHVFPPDPPGQENRGNCATTSDTIWLEISYPGFHAFEHGRFDKENWDDLTVYLPTPWRLQQRAGSDWY